MHNGNWHDAMGNGTWGWLPMMIMMVAVWAGLLWIGVTLLKRNHSQPAQSAALSQAASPARPTAPEILGERLARGEIEPDDYRQRLDALHRQPGA